VKAVILSISRLRHGQRNGNNLGTTEATSRLGSSGARQGCVLGRATATILALRQRRQRYDLETHDGWSLDHATIVILALQWSRQDNGREAHQSWSLDHT
jgi:hypothetical protein